MRRSIIGLMLLLALALLLAPLAVEAQPAGKVRRLGILHYEAAPSAAELQQAPFWQAMHELGWVEGHNIIVERRSAEGHSERLPALAAELVHLGVGVIVPMATPAALALKQATTTIPMVMMGAGDPVGSGLVASLAWPGGNITGLAVMDPEVIGKQLEFLKDGLPTVSRVAVLWDPATGPVPVRGLEGAA